MHDIAVITSFMLFAVTLALTIMAIFYWLNEKK